MMSGYIRITVGSILGISLFLGWWFIWLPVLLWYAVYENTWWVVILAVVIDGYYGAFYEIPHQSLAVLLIAIMMHLLRPYIFTQQ